MNRTSEPVERLHRRQALGVLSAAGLSAGLWNPALAADAPQPASAGGEFLVGLDGWSLSFALGMRRRELKPTRPLTAWDILGKVRQWGLQGAQVETPSMPKLGSNDFQAFCKAVAQANVYWEVSAGSVQNEKGVLQAIEYNVALGSTVVRAFMEGFAIQFANVSLDDYVSNAIQHIKNLLPEFERRRLHLCLENHGGLRTKHLCRVLKTFPSQYLGVNLDTGNAILTLEDPLEVAGELARRTYTCHLKDWKLLRTPDGIVARGCSLGEGVVDLKAILKILRQRAPKGPPLHLNIESPQEYLPLKLFTADYWRTHGDVSGSEVGRFLSQAEKQNSPASPDDRIALERGEPERAILAEEEAAVTRSIAYCRDVLRLL